MNTDKFIKIFLHAILNIYIYDLEILQIDFLK